MYRCLECRTRRSTWGLLTRHVKKTGHKACNCGGYHYKHRPGSPACDKNMMADVYKAWLAGECSDAKLEQIKRKRKAENDRGKNSDK